MGALSWWHWLIVAIVVVILFGSSKLPDAARGLGRSMRILKSEMEEMRNDDSSAPQTEAQRELESKDKGSATTSDPKPNEEKKSA